ESETYRELIQQHLRTWTVTSEAVATGESAFEILRHEQQAGRPFSMVILSMHLPDMDAVAFAKLVRDDPSLKAAKLLVMSGGDAGEAATLPWLGLAGSVGLPPKPEELFDRLQHLLGSQNFHRQPAA